MRPIRRRAVVGRFTREFPIVHGNHHRVHPRLHTIHKPLRAGNCVNYLTVNDQKSLSSRIFAGRSGLIFPIRPLWTVVAAWRVLVMAVVRPASPVTFHCERSRFRWTSTDQSRGSLRGRPDGRWEPYPDEEPSIRRMAFHIAKPRPAAESATGDWRPDVAKPRGGARPPPADADPRKLRSTPTAGNGNSQRFSGIREIRGGFTACLEFWRWLPEEVRRTCSRFSWLSTDSFRW